MTTMHPHENTTWPVPAGTPAHVAKALNDRKLYNGAVRSVLYGILKDGKLVASLNMDSSLLADIYDINDKDAFNLHNAMREYSDHCQPSARKYELTEVQAELLHVVVADRCTSYKNLIVGAVESGDLPRAQRLAGELRKLTDLYALLNVASHKEQDGRK